jgi:(p)ppGpp synthase/HD superfamily hydrolase
MTTEEMLRLKGIYLAPYMQLATALIGKVREGGGNMFRHQLDTMATLIDYGYIDSVLLKASVIHDLLEDVVDFNHNLIMSTDFEGPQVYDLVMEVTRFPKETKPEFLTRIRRSGSKEAKVLKVADRISNMISLGFVNNVEFISRYTEETVQYIIPIADEVDKTMGAELESLAESRRKYVSVFTQAG